MQEQANVSLSAFELELVSQSGWILTKNGIIQKVYNLFGQLSEVYQSLPQRSALPVAVRQLSPKISKGENYLGLPWVMLDDPRCFSKEDVFAIRSFFWWGHYFTCTLQLKGRYKRLFEDRIKAAVEKGLFHDAWLNATDEEWIHQLDAEKWIPVSVSSVAATKNREVLKLVVKCDLAEWNRATSFFTDAVTRYLQVLAD